MAKVEVCDISGMGGREYGGYEWGCQVIAARTARFLKQAKESGQFPQFHSFKNITGLLVGDNEAARKLDDFILEHELLKGMTGAMHEYGVMHGMKLFELGREGYLAELRKVRKDESFYEFEENDAFPEDANVHNSH